jgi:very-short-patch-repair endonuclease
VHRSSLAPSEVQDAVTTPVRTVLDLARSRPLATGLAAADSALRQRLVLPGDLRRGAAELRGPGSKRARTVAKHADARAESVLESALRAILVAAGIHGFDLQLQIDEGLRARVDLGHPGLRIVLEADSFAHHGHRSALARDCRRYNELTLRGWLVLRFAWEHVMFEPEWVERCIREALASR